MRLPRCECALAALLSLFFASSSAGQPSNPNPGEPPAARPTDRSPPTLGELYEHLEKTLREVSAAHRALLGVVAAGHIPRPGPLLEESAATVAAVRRHKVRLGDAVLPGLGWPFVPPLPDRSGPGPSTLRDRKPDAGDAPQGAGGSTGSGTTSGSGGTSGTGRSS